jgi:hypothetical protein
MTTEPTITIPKSQHGFDTPNLDVAVYDADAPYDKEKYKVVPEVDLATYAVTIHTQPWEIACITSHGLRVESQILLCPLAALFEEIHRCLASPDVQAVVAMNLSKDAPWRREIADEEEGDADRSIPAQDPEAERC